MSTLTEIAESPAVAARLLERAWPVVEAVARDARHRDIRLALIAARGTSDHAAIYAQYVLGGRNRLPVALAAPSLSSLYGTPPRLDSALVIGISQSGRSPDIVAVLADARRQGGSTLAITNDAASDLAATADHVLDLGAGPELGVAATKTYTSSLLAIAMLSAAMDDDPAGRRDLDTLPDALRAALASEAQVAACAAGRAADDQCAVLGRGYHYATAREWALKVKELGYVLADPYSAADFQHGPIALVEPGYPVLAIATTGPAQPEMLALLERLRAAGARLLVASDDPRALAAGDAVPLDPAVPEWLAPIPAIVPGQLYAVHLAVARGHDPERPRNLSKVTLTR
jgi:glucosamine--fructose-6-phosphate aminotransferase (isomerizing)